MGSNACFVLFYHGLLSVGSGMLIEGHKGAYCTFTLSLQQNPSITRVGIELVHYWTLQ